jgi:hypothetical protein
MQGDDLPTAALGRARSSVGWKIEHRRNGYGPWLLHKLIAYQSQSVPS